MKIALTGAAGFIGSRLARLLVSAGHEVVAIDIYPASSLDDTAGVEAVRCDVRDRGALAIAFEGCQAVFHLAAAHHDFGISTKTFNDVNVGGMENVCAAATAAGIQDICFYSTVAVFGAATPPLNESTEPQPQSDYGRSKLQAEQVLKKWTEGDDANRALVIRPTVTFGPGNFANMFSLIRQIESGKYVQIGKCENIKSLSYVENLIAATVFAWQRPDRASWELYNYVEKPDLTSKQIADVIYTALGRKPPTFSIPYWIARTLALPMDLLILLTGKNFAVSGARIRKFSRDVTHFEADAIQKIGFQPAHDLHAGITDMTEWYLREGKQKAADVQSELHVPGEEVFTADAPS